jgi:two-component system osmolarity sensor histidine kinase EnvZ
VLATLIAILAAAALLARQLTHPLRRLASIADRFAAGEPPEEAPVGGPVEVRHVQQAFLRMSRTLLAAEREREALLAGVSHDLRTPISRMRLAVGLYGEDANPRLLEEIEHDLGELEQAMAQFIAYARSNHAEAGALAVLDEIVSAVIDARRVAQEGGAVAIGFEPGAPAALHLETFNVQRVVENLVDNAVRHGRPPVHVRTEQSDLFATLVVRDAGAGIPEEKRQAVLQPFVRLASSDAKSAGSGLGLAIVERIAHRHGGTVTLSNVPGGFEVRVTFSRRPGLPPQV